MKYISKEKGLLLPMHYNYVLQALLYNTFSNEIANFLHTEGFTLNNRRFKLFTFSRILEKGSRVYGKRLAELKSQLNINSKFLTRKNSKVEEALYFENGFSFYFSSPKNFLIEDIGSRAVSIPKSILSGQEIFIESIEVLPHLSFSNKLNIKTLSPVTVYSTAKIEGKRKLTYYYSPHEKEFPDLIQKNAEKKYVLINGVKPKGSLNITPLYFNEKRNRAVVYFKDTRIEGWTGVFTLEGEPDIINVVYEAGLGSKNPEGFGMWEPYEDRRSQDSEKKHDKD